RTHSEISWEATVRGKLFDGQNDPFPGPPYPEEDWIAPIRTPAELIREAEEQHNCVAAYIEDAREGRSYFYRVLSPERATLELYRDARGNWCLHDIRTIDNGKSATATWQAAHRWLKREWPVEVEEEPGSWDLVPWSAGQEPEMDEVPD
ncbi:MAG: PcfJ domain-containing protein, partial [Thermoanaerobaculia bacterium]|nr:PcfJ domain-containing protein [Thermoanaerobaculia bacterium]